MSEKKELSIEELENVSGGTCENGGGTIKCTSCDSTDLTLVASTYARAKYKCNSCGNEFTVDIDSL